MTKLIFRLGSVLSFVCLFPWMGRANTLYFPQVVAGGGYSTTFTLLNTDSIPLTGQLRVFNQNGSQRSSPSEWESISIPASGSVRFTLNNSGSLIIGSAYFQTAANVNGVATFERRKIDGPLETIAGVLGAPASSRFLIPVEISASSGTGVALVNTAETPTNIRLLLLGENGATIGATTDARFNPLAGRQQFSDFVTNFFPQLALTDFKGTLVIEATNLSQQIAATGLVVKEGLLSALPAIGSFAPPKAGILMGIVDGEQFSLIFQNREITLSGSYSFVLDPGTYEVSGKMSTKLIVGLGSGSISGLVPKVVVGSIRNVEGPQVQVYPCFIVYSSESGMLQPFRFQFDVTSDNGDTCKGTLTTNSFFAQILGPTDLRAVSPMRESVVVAGTRRLIDGNRNLFVRSYDVRSGELRWFDETASVAGLNTAVFAINAQDNLFVAGYVPSLPCCSNIFVRAYNANTGRVLWTDVYKKGRDDLPQSIAVRSVLVVVGYGGNNVFTSSGGVDFLVRAYEPATGSVLWEDRVDTGAFVDDAAWLVALDSVRAFVLGTSSEPGSQRDVFIRAYDAFRGTFLWQTPLPGIMTPTSLTVVDGVLFVSGYDYSIPLNPIDGTSLD